MSEKDTLDEEYAVWAEAVSQPTEEDIEDMYQQYCADKHKELCSVLLASRHVHVDYSIMCCTLGYKRRFCSSGILTINKAGVLRLTGGDGYISTYRPDSPDDIISWFKRFDYIGLHPGNNITQKGVAYA